MVLHGPKASTIWVQLFEDDKLSSLHLLIYSWQSKVHNLDGKPRTDPSIAFPILKNCCTRTRLEHGARWGTVQRGLYGIHFYSINHPLFSEEWYITTNSFKKLNGTRPFAQHNGRFVYFLNDRIRSLLATDNFATEIFSWCACEIPEHCN